MGKNNNKSVKVVPQAKQTNKRGGEGDETGTGGPINIDDLSDEDDEDQDEDGDACQPAQK